MYIRYDMKKHDTTVDRKNNKTIYYETNTKRSAAMFVDAILTRSKNDNDK